MENTCAVTLSRILQPEDIGLVINAIEMSYQLTQAVWQTLLNNPILTGMVAGGLLGRFMVPSFLRLFVSRRRQVAINSSFDYWSNVEF
jgi:hypothetical protein